jgi:hypothetical protein
MTDVKKFFVFLLASQLSSGCMLFGGLRVDPVATSAQKPSNVAVYVAVSRAGDPAIGLTERSFVISEDGQELSPEQTRQVLLPRTMVAAHRALLLVDMSGPVTEGDTRSAIAMAAARFVTKAHASEPVTVYAFDGGAKIRLIGEYPEGTDEIAEIPALAAYAPSDPSSNLHSAVIEALAELDTRLMTAQKPLRIGSLVVFARGADLAGRVTAAKMREALSESQHLVFAIGIKGAPGFSAARLGREGAFEAEAETSLLATFDEAGARVGSTVGRYYLLSYCSPARAGTRGLRIKVVTTDDKNKEVSGSMSTDIDTSGFTSGCDPTARPAFVVPAAPEAPHEKPDGQGAEDGDKRAGSGKVPKAVGGRVSGKPASSVPPGPAGEPDEGEAVAPPPSKPGYAQ